jgi:signal transduction histidine kinase
LQVTIPAHLPALTTDRNTLERIIAELLNNACKYTPPQGQIFLSMQEGSLENQVEPSGVLITIRNQAEIPASELARVFDKFYRVPNGDRWKQGGTGLGLALVQRMITELQGTIQVTSEEGWTTFTVHIPTLQISE